MMSIDFAQHPEHVNRIVNAALEAAHPGSALSRHWHDARMELIESCYLVGAGKASLEMTLRFQELYDGRIKGGAVAVVPERLQSQLERPDSFELFPAAHPLPDERNLTAASAIARVATQAGKGDIVVCLLSGGGSAHLSLPTADLTLEDLRQISSALMRAGAPIEALNTVRKHCEILKGGGLARLASPATVRTLILSDVIGDRFDLIASGPTAPDPSTYQDALEVLKTYRLINEVPPVTRWLEGGAQGKHAETLKETDPITENIQNRIIGSNRLAVEAVERFLISEGWSVTGREFDVQGEARTVGKWLGRLAVELGQRPDRPCAWLIGGETPVTVRGDGLGGRNQEMALSAALALKDTANIAIAAFSTDGIDGPTEAAGALVTGETCRQAHAIDVNPQDYLNRNDSYTFFDRVGGLIRTGPTGTNVNDLAVILAY
jgi:hydroxypyruvate reductase